MALIPLTPKAIIYSPTKYIKYSCVRLVVDKKTQYIEGAGDKEPMLKASMLTSPSIKMHIEESLAQFISRNKHILGYQMHN